MTAACDAKPPADTYSTRAPICPHCGHQERDLEAFHYDECTAELECGHCGVLFDVRIYNSTSWTCSARKAPTE